MSRIIEVPIKDIRSNPFRKLGDYPYVERKVEALQRSIADIGLWEGVIARPASSGDKYEIAFGHHRVEAARRNKLQNISLIVRRLTDEQMLQFMGRENMEDYNADFLCMLETWEAGAEFRSPAREQMNKPIDIARLLGWTVESSDRDCDKLNHTARACNAAHGLISGGFVSRDDLQALSVKDAEAILERAQSRMEQLERMGTKTQRPRKEIEHAKKQIGRSVKETARQSRAGQVAQKDLRGKVDVNAYRFAKESKRQTPLFEIFGKALADGIGKMLKADTAAEKLEEVCKVVTQVTMDDDKRVIARLDFELNELGERSSTWRKRIITADKKVTHLRLTDGGRK